MGAGSDVVLSSDRRQSISQQDVDNIVAANERAEADGGDVRDVPEPGVSCPQQGGKHGRMLMSMKTGLLECGVCGYSVAAPK